MLERLNEEIKRRTHVVRIFPNGDRRCTRSTLDHAREAARKAADLGEGRYKN
jgi:transposase-like protein